MEEQKYTGNKWNRVRAMVAMGLLISTVGISSGILQKDVTQEPTPQQISQIAKLKGIQLDLHYNSVGSMPPKVVVEDGERQPVDTKEVFGQGRSLHYNDVSIDNEEPNYSVGNMPPKVVVKDGEKQPVDAMEVAGQGRSLHYNDVSIDNEEPMYKKVLNSIFDFFRNIKENLRTKHLTLPEAENIIVEQQNGDIKQNNNGFREQLAVGVKEINDINLAVDRNEKKRTEDKER